MRLHTVERQYYFRQLEHNCGFWCLKYGYLFTYFSHLWHLHVDHSATFIGKICKMMMLSKLMQRAVVILLKFVSYLKISK